MAFERKVSKESVHYTPTAKHRSERCAICRHWLGKSECEIVEGQIAAAGWCNKFRPNP